ncbi:MAG: hypothetical protein M0T76_06625 [Desulfobacteraceae bacterium]|nr:hypothetical protein [Desulfobacteraceae bacterium]
MTNRPSTPLLATLLAALLLLPAAISHAEGKGKLVFPPDKSIVNQLELRLVGVSPEAGATVNIKVKAAGGGQEASAQVAKGAFSQTVKLSPGANTITVSGGGVEASRTVFLYTKETPPPANQGLSPFYLHPPQGDITAQCDKCHQLDPQAPDYTNFTQKGPCISQGCHDNFGDKKYKHGPFAKGLCLDCHNPHGSPNKDMTKKARAALCFTCHSDDAGMASSDKVVHFPVKQGDCLLCHEQHQSDQPFHLKGKSVVELCGRCHEKTLIKFTYMHAPFKEGDCIACHSPHVSKYKRLLNEQGSALCLNCHKEREEEFKRRYVHEPVKKDCTICHDPHGSEAPDHLRTPLDKSGRYIKYAQPVKELCLSCHRKLNPDIANEIEHAKVQHKPVAEGKCTICHTPHSTNFKKQLRTSLEDACFGCHKKLAQQIKGSKYLHGPVRTDDCAQCHLVHGSELPKLLRANFSLNYTEDFSLQKYALCFNCHNSKVITDPNGLETGFRNGNENLHYKHVNRKDGRTCMTCHEIHASNQPKHIRTTIPMGKNYTINLQYTKTATGGGCVVGCHKPRNYDREHPVNYQQQPAN